MEVQLFHFYGFKKPVNDKVVVSLLFKNDPNPNAKNDPFLDLIINTKNNQTTATEVDMSKYLTMDTFSMNYFYYAGSLTYPYCSGAYSWIVIDQFFYAPKAQIDAIHAAYLNTADGKIKKGNYRKIQSRTGRYVRYNGDPTNPNAISNQIKLKSSSNILGFEL